MAAEIKHLAKIKQIISESEPEIIHEEPNGRVVNLRYLLAGIALADMHPGRLNVYDDQTNIELLTDGLANRVVIYDTETDGAVTRYDRRNFRNRTSLDILVIQTEIWRKNIGVRITHVA